MNITRLIGPHFVIILFLFCITSCRHVEESSLTKDASTSDVFDTGEKTFKDSQALSISDLAFGGTQDQELRYPVRCISRATQLTGIQSTTYELSDGGAFVFKAKFDPILPTRYTTWYNLDLREIDGDLSAVSASPGDTPSYVISNYRVSFRKFDDNGKIYYSSKSSFDGSRSSPGGSERTKHDQYCWTINSI